VAECVVNWGGIFNITVEDAVFLTLSFPENEVDFSESFDYKADYDSPEVLPGVGIW
jgi:hypothetical protein